MKREERGWCDGGGNGVRWQKNSARYLTAFSHQLHRLFGRRQHVSAADEHAVDVKNECGGAGRVATAAIVLGAGQWRQRRRVLLLLLLVMPAGASAGADAHATYDIAYCACTTSLQRSPGLRRSGQDRSPRHDRDLWAGLLSAAAMLC